MNFRFLVIILLLFGFPSLCQAQVEDDLGVITINMSDMSDDDIFNDANLLMDDKLYEAALPLWLNLLKKDPENSNLNYKAGVCYFNSTHHREKSLNYLLKAAEKVSKNYDIFSHTEKGAPFDVFFYLASAEHLNYKFDKAVEYFNLFTENAPKKHFLRSKVARGIEMCANATELIRDSITIKITNLGANINSKYDEHSPVVSLDEKAIYFTTRRLRKDSSNYYIFDTEHGKHFEDIYVSFKDKNGVWQEPEVINFSRKDQHEATISLSADGQTLYIYRDDGGDGNLYKSTLFTDRWSTPELLGSDINTKSFESHITVSTDDKTLYFTSDRRGGIGGMDIYRCVRLPNGQWSMAQNLGPTVNTIYDENSPFVHPDGKTLYFSSQGHKSMGGYDIFFSELQDDGTWTEPENVGYPINTPDNDLVYITSPDGRRAYYSSQGHGDSYGETDIYLIKQPGKEEVALTLIKGFIDVPEGQELPENIEIIMTDNETGEFVGRGKPLKRNGSFVFIIPPGKNYNLSYESDGKEFYNENIYVPVGSEYKEVQKDITLNPMKLETDVEGAVVVKSSIPKKIPKWQIRFANIAQDMPEGLVVQYIDEDGNIIYEETVEKGGFFKYRELASDKNYMFKLLNLSSQELCDKGEIVLVGKDGQPYKLIPDENCNFVLYEERKANFKFRELKKDIPEGMVVQYLDEDGNVIFESTMDEKGSFPFHELPSYRSYVLKLKTEDPDFCKNGEIVISTFNGQRYKLVADDGCVFRQIEPPKFQYLAFSNDFPEGLMVQYVDDSGNVLFTEKINEDGSFAFHELPPDMDKYALKLFSEGGNPCLYVEMILLGQNRRKINSNEDCLFVLSSKQLKGFKFQKLGLDLPQGLVAQYLKEDGTIMYEESVKNSGFDFYSLSASKSYLLKLVVNDQTLCKKGEIEYIGNDGSGYILRAGEDCVFRVSEIIEPVKEEKVADVPEEKVTDIPEKVIDTPEEKVADAPEEKVADVPEEKEVTEAQEKQEEHKVVTTDVTGKTHYEKFFGYNKNKLDPNDREYKNLLKEAVKQAGEKNYINISIESSASRVPTKTYLSNEVLTKMRAEEAKQFIIQSLKAKGVSEDKINFVNITTLVQGPTYKKDAGKNSKVYTPYQYVKIWLN